MNSKFSCNLPDPLQSHPWSSTQTIALSYQLLSLLRRLLGAPSTSAMLLMTTNSIDDTSTTSSEQLVRKMTARLRSCLDKSSFKRHPGAKSCLVWLLHQFQHPHLGPLLSEFLPHILTISDDWLPENKILGVTCLRHVVNNCSKTELEWYGRAELLCSVLNPLLHSHEIELLDAVYPTFLDYLRIFDDEGGETCKASASDRVLLHYLKCLEVETKPEVKRCLVKYLGPLLELQNIRIVRWLTRLTRVSETILALPEEEETTRGEMLSCLLFVMKTAPPQRLRSYTRTLLQILFRLLHEISESDHDDKWKMLSGNCLECIRLLKQVAGEEFQCLTKGMADQMYESSKVSTYFKDAVVELQS